MYANLATHRQIRLSDTMDETHAVDVMYIHTDVYRVHRKMHIDRTMPLGVAEENDLFVMEHHLVAEVEGRKRRLHQAWNWSTFVVEAVDCNGVLVVRQEVGGHDAFKQTDVDR